MGRRIKLPNVRIGTTSQCCQIYVVPTIRITHDKFLYGFYTLELWWLKWGIEIMIGDKNNFTNNETFTKDLV